LPDESTATLAAWRALHDGVAVADRNDRLRMWFTGPTAGDTLNGLVTNDVAALEPGNGLYAAALTPKGKVIADVRILRLAEAFLTDVTPAAAEGWSTMIRKYVNPRLARYEDRSAQTGDVGVFGPVSLRLLRDAMAAGDGIPESLPTYAVVTIDAGGSPVTVVRTPEFGVDGYDAIGDRDVIAVLHQRLLALGGVPATDEALDIARIEAGWPVLGRDMDENTLAQEVDMDRLGAISHEKGCYTGQETVARVHFRGHVNRRLRGLQFETGDPAEPGAAILDAEGKVTGTVRSAVHSPRLGPIALALVRREVEPGVAVTAGGHRARVVELPFPA
jgi:folate-binding protein YgfZ